MPSPEVLEYAQQVLLNALKNEDGRVAMPAHMILAASISDGQRFLSREAYQYLLQACLIRQPAGSRVFFLTDSGKQEALTIQSSSPK